MGFGITTLIMTIYTTYQLQGQKGLIIFPPLLVSSKHTYLFSLCPSPSGSRTQG